MEIQNQNALEKVLENIRKVIIGKDETIRLLLTALLSDGHVLLEDVPGTGKTKLAKALAKSLHADYSRIQFTPDLLPGDITGLNIFDRKSNDFVLRKGPVFTNILLADEINRATPRTQAGLLECMEERQVTIDGETYPLGSTFFVIATQNPIETAGTFPLPEAQLDRFMMKLSVGLPNREEELDILARYLEKDPLTELTGVLSLDELALAKQEVCKVYVHKAVQEYIVNIITESRNEESIMMGVSPRGSLALLRCVKAYAWLQGRNFVIPDDVKAVAVPVLAHRIVMDFSRDNYKESVSFIQNILQRSDVPTEDFRI